MCAIRMQINAILLLTGHVATHLRTPLQHEALLPPCRHLMRKHAAKQPTADNQIIIHLYFSFTLLSFMHSAI